MATDNRTGARGGDEGRPAHATPECLAGARRHVNAVLGTARARQRATTPHPTPHETLRYLCAYVVALPPRRRQRLERELILVALADRLGRDA
ncbi:MAG TPA: hypothetical protein VFW96_22465 [Thermomicrobiales bacterium]|nr:hypothetical protein [Thermomicrobiales bacterium]